jgi:hypothetical protein
MFYLGGDKPIERWNPSNELRFASEKEALKHGFVE